MTHKRPLCLPKFNHHSLNSPNPLADTHTHTLKMMITAVAAAVTADVNAAESLPRLCMSSKLWMGLRISPVTMAEDE